MLKNLFFTIIILLIIITTSCSSESATDNNYPIITPDSILVNNLHYNPGYFISIAIHGAETFNFYDSNGNRLLRHRGGVYRQIANNEFERIGEGSIVNLETPGFQYQLNQGDYLLRFNILPDALINTITVMVYENWYITSRFSYHFFCALGNLELSITNNIPQLTSSTVDGIIEPNFIENDFYILNYVILNRPTYDVHTFDTN